MNRAESVKKGDFYWNNVRDLPQDWTRGAFHGNGVLGSMIYFVNRDGVWYLHMELGCNKVYDRRPSRDFWMAKQFDNPRLPIGYMEYPVPMLGGEDIGCVEFEMHTDIYLGRTDLLLRKRQKGGVISEISCRFYICAEQPVIVIEQKSGEVQNWRFTPREAVSPRQSFGIEKKEEFRVDQNYQKNELPKVTIQDVDGVVSEVISEQQLANDYRTVTVCQYDINENKLFVTIDQKQNLHPEEVRDVLRREKNTEYKNAHQEWWKRYYELSGLEIPDKRLQVFYWRQMYKLGSTLHRDSPVLDNQGVWLSTTPWPGTWWNLNVQLSYWPLYTSGRLEQADSLNRHLAKYQDDLIENVAPEYRYDSSAMGTNTTYNLKSKAADPRIDNGAQFVELGNLTWTLHDCWLYYRMTLDKEMLQQLLYPLLRRSINYYLHFIWKGRDGKWHLPPTDSPEYGERCEDCNYDLSLLRWGCKTLLEIVKILDVSDEKEDIWQDVCRELAAYPEDETGYMIGKGVPYAKTHRHFSHLMMHVPLYLVNRENSDSWDLLEKSIRHWFSYKGDILGFSYVGASLMYSAYQRGTEALEYIQRLLDGHITENSMYQEAGPVIETPLAAAECIQQLLLQSWGGKIRVFPAMPKEWKEASFDRFSAQGGFRVSAVYENGRTSRIEIESLAGEPCVVETDMRRVRIRYQGTRTEERTIDRYCEITLARGESVILENTEHEKDSGK